MKRLIEILFLSLAIPTGLFTTYSCGKTRKQDNILKQDSIRTDNSDTMDSDKLNASNEKVIDSVTLDLDTDGIMEMIVITQGYYEMDQFKFDIYKSQMNVGTLYSQKQYPWLDSLEKESNSCGILWESHYLNGSDCGGDAYYGYVLKDNKLEHVVSIPDSYYGCYSIGAPKGDPFYWGNISLLKIKYNCKKSVEITVDLDLHKSPSWEQMDTINQVLYDKKHKLNYVWISDQEKYLVKSRIKKDTAYSIETVYDMTEYLENEFGLKWP